MKRHVLCCVLASFFIAGFARADLASAIAKIKPSVVIMGTYKSTNNPRFTLRGTGFVVAQAGAKQTNLVVTNAHVLEQSVEEDPQAAWFIQIRVEGNALQMRSATVLDLDKLHDLALLRFDGPPVPGLVVRDSSTVQEGMSIAFTGFPIGGALGFSPVTHRGVVSSITTAALPTPSAQQLNEKAIRSLRMGSFEIFQLDATAYPGNSGGPLFDPETAEVVGVVNMVFIKGTRESALTHPSGISYAIPSRFILPMLNRGDTRQP